MKWRRFIGIALVGLAIQSVASDVTQGGFGAGSSPAKEQSGAKAKSNSYPFSGELESHDAASITLKGKRKQRVLLLTPETRIQKSGKPATLKEARAGERVSGSARKDAEGKEQAVTVNLKGTDAASK